VRHPPNPIRSEANAFEFLLWALAAIAVFVVIVAILEAVT
jgi:hypothetical protein